MTGKTLQPWVDTLAHRSTWWLNSASAPPFDGNPSAAPRFGPFCSIVPPERFWFGMGTLLQDTRKELPWLEAATGAIRAALAAHLSTGGDAGA